MICWCSMFHRHLNFSLEIQMHALKTKRKMRERMTIVQMSDNQEAD